MDEIEILPISEFEEIERTFNEDCRDKKIIARGVHNRASRRSGLRKGVTFYSDLLKGKEKKLYMGTGELKVENIGEYYTKSLETLPRLAEIEDMGFDTAKEIINAAFKKFLKKDLQLHWKLNGSQFYKKLIPMYDIQTDKRRNANRTKKGQLDPKIVPTFEQINAMNPVEAKRFIEELMDKYTIAELRKHWSLSEFIWNKRIITKFGIETKSRNKEVSGENVAVETNQTPSQEAYYKKIIDEYNRMVAEKAQEVDGFKLTFNGEYSGEMVERKILKIVDTFDPDVRYKVKFEIVELEEIKEEVKEEKQDI